MNTGEVVVRSITTGQGHVEYTPIGHSTNLASRLQTLAAPGSIAVSETVRKLVEGYFSLKALGPARVKGVSEPVNVYEVTGLGPLRTRLQWRASSGDVRGRKRSAGARNCGGKRSEVVADGSRGQRLYRSSVASAEKQAQSRRSFRHTPATGTGDGGLGNPIAHGRTLSEATAALVRMLAPDVALEAAGSAVSLGFGASTS